MSLFFMMLVAVAASGVLLAGMTALYHAPFGQRRRIREGRHGSMSAKNFKANAAGNGVFSLSIVALLTWASWPWLYASEPVAAWRVALEAVAVLMVYDFMYYFLHRYPFHVWKRLKRVHAVHHRVRNPSAIDSLYLHPVEAAAGLVLLWVAAGLVALVTGPLSVVGFGVAFFVYSTMNVLVHGGIDFKLFPMSVLGSFARRHDKHHAHMAAGNYASLTPFWDKMFGTEVD